MNSVTLVGKLISKEEAPPLNGFIMARGKINIARPYRIKDKYVFDAIDLYALGGNADKLLKTKEGQIIGINGILEKEGARTHVNVKGIIWYSDTIAAAIDVDPDGTAPSVASAGFQVISPEEIPDF